MPYSASHTRRLEPTRGGSMCKVPQTRSRFRAVAQRNASLLARQVSSYLRTPRRESAAWHWLPKCAVQKGELCGDPAPTPRSMTVHAVLIFSSPCDPPVCVQGQHVHKARHEHAMKRARETTGRFASKAQTAEADVTSSASRLSSSASDALSSTTEAPSADQEAHAISQTSGQPAEPYKCSRKQ